MVVVGAQAAGAAVAAPPPPPEAGAASGAAGQLSLDEQPSDGEEGDDEHDPRPVAIRSKRKVSVLSAAERMRRQAAKLAQLVQP